MIGYKSSLRKPREIEIIPGVFSDHSGMKLEIKTIREAGKFTSMWEIKRHSTEQPMSQR